MRKNEVYILSVDAKDLYIANNLVNPSPVGYNIKYSNGEFNLSKFTNTLDYSLDFIKLEEVYQKVYRDIHFTFNYNDREYTKRVINVTFNYSVKAYNKIDSNLYIKFGYKIDKDCLSNGVYILNNELIAIRTDTPIPEEHVISQELLGNYFVYEDGEYKAKTIPVLKTVADLRDELYENGFYCDGIKFIRFKRSSGSSRVGKCLFIDERLYSRMHRWEMCGIKIRQGAETDLAALEAYIALTLSSIIDTIEISAENILVIDDYESVFTDDVISTEMDGKWLKTHHTTREISNSIWDGQSLIDISLMGEYSDKGMLLLRNRFFKSCCFNTNIQQFFLDNNITEISQLNGYTKATKIEDVKLITTPSSIKYLKFGTLDRWLDLLETTFGIVKYEKKTHFYDGRMVQTHYQLLNTLQLTQEEVDEFLEPSVNHIKLLTKSLPAVRYQIKMPDQTDTNYYPLYSKNDIVYKLLGLSDDFAKTKIYSDFIRDLIKSYKKSIKSGRVLINGNYSTLFGNPLEMLKHSIFKFDGTSSLGVGEIHSKRFEYNQTLLGSRSPHVTIGNIWLPRNVASQEIDHYFNITSEIVCMNSIGESVLDRLSGCDFDSDTALLTDDKILIAAAKRNYEVFKVPTNNVESVKRKRKYTNLEKSDLDIKTSDNKIGEIINLSQELNSKLWHMLNNGSEFNDIEELYYDICKLDVMSGIEIDKAKKEFLVNTYAEMKKIREKYLKRDSDGRMIKPNFFGHIAKSKGYYDNKKKNYKAHDTTMDYVQRNMNRLRLSYNTNYIEFKDLLYFPDFNIKSAVRDQVNRIMSLISDTRVAMNNVWQDKSINNSDKFILSENIRTDCIRYIEKLKISKHTMYYLVTQIERPENSHVKNTMFSILFGTPIKTFYDLIYDNSESVKNLKECENGEIKIYNFNFAEI